MPISAWKTEISPEEINLYRSGDYVELLSTEKINELLQRPKSYGTNALLRVKHFRWSQLLVNIVLLLLAIPCVLTREPGTLKVDIIKCVFLTGFCMCSTFVARQIAGNPPPGETWHQQWPLIMAWVPIFVFLPLAIYLLDQKHAKKTDVGATPRSPAVLHRPKRPQPTRPLQFPFASSHIESYINVVRHNALDKAARVSGVSRPDATLPSHFLATPAVATPRRVFFHPHFMDGAIML